VASLEELEARIAVLEDRVIAVPFAAAPITIGELTDVPAPGSPIASQWAQEVTRRSLHRFASIAARDAAYPAAGAGQGAQCVVAQIVYVSNGANWLPIPNYLMGVVVLGANVGNAAGQAALTVYTYGQFALLEGVVQVSIPMTADATMPIGTAPAGFRPVHISNGVARYVSVAGSVNQICPASIDTLGAITTVGGGQGANSQVAISIPFVTP
jgi:hypothetical protein